MYFIRKGDNMQTKLTISIDKNIIKRAKIYASGRNKSLSRIIEDYLKVLSDSSSIETESSDIPPVTGSLGGILKGKKEIDFHSSITDYLENKHK